MYEQFHGMFAVGDAVGGGTEADVLDCLESCLQALGLCEEDLGVVIFATSHFLTADDLALNSATWRSLLVTAMLAAVKYCIKDALVCRKAMARLLDTIEHWWPRCNS